MTPAETQEAAQLVRQLPKLRAIDDAIRKEQSFELWSAVLKVGEFDDEGGDGSASKDHVAMLPHEIARRTVSAAIDATVERLRELGVNPVP